MTDRPAPLHPSRDVIATDLTHELILLDPRSGEMFALNPAGRRIWLSLPAPPDDIAARLVAEFEVDLAQARRDVNALLAALLAADLITTERQASR